MSKNPISVLEELAAAKKIDKPCYRMVVAANGFICELICGNVKVNSCPFTNKKDAKYDCATKALQQITDSLNSHENPLQELSENNIATVNFNAVGKLNEQCSQNGLQYPTYIDKWHDKGFIVECTVLSCTTTGKGVTKKQAKQAAALEMLKQLETKDIKKNNQNDTHSEKDKDIINHIINLKKKEQTDVGDDNLVKDMKIGTKQVKVVRTVDTLTKELNKFGCNYKVVSLQKNPLILLLKFTTGDDKCYTFIASEENFSDCHVSLLSAALEGLTILLK